MADTGGHPNLRCPIGASNKYQREYRASGLPGDEGFLKDDLNPVMRDGSLELAVGSRQLAVTANRPLQTANLGNRITTHGSRCSGVRLVMARLNLAAGRSDPAVRGRSCGKPKNRSPRVNTWWRSKSSAMRTTQASASEIGRSRYFRCRARSGAMCTPTRKAMRTAPFEYLWSDPREKAIISVGYQP